MKFFCNTRISIEKYTRMKGLKIILVLLVAVCCAKKKVEIYSENNLAIKMDAAFMRVLERGDNEIVANMLREEELEVDKKMGREQRTPLHWAAWFGQREIAACLIDSGAVVEAIDREGRTPLHLAAYKGWSMVASLLVERGAAINVKDSYGNTPLHVAGEMGHHEVVYLLLRQQEVGKEEENNVGYTPLHLAALRGHEGVVAHLIEKEANKEVQAEKDGRKPLHLAALGGHEGVVNLLIKHGATIDTKDADRATPLALAKDEEHKAVVNILLWEQRRRACCKWWKCLKEKYPGVKEEADKHLNGQPSNTKLGCLYGLLCPLLRCCCENDAANGTSSMNDKTPLNQPLNDE
ncbi:MAG: ankyrin repeat domain-containing protein [Cytophagales bacterium]|nr:ankyrin repeat domain-containing protein [Cytophagales bacterium]